MYVCVCTVAYVQTVMCNYMQIWFAISFHLAPDSLWIRALRDRFTETPTSRIRTQPVIRPLEISQIRDSAEWSDVYIQKAHPLDCINTWRAKITSCRAQKHASKAQSVDVLVHTEVVMWVWKRDNAERNERIRPR